MSIRDSLDSLSKSYFTEITEKVSSIYIDMEILQDFKLGALLQSATVKEEIEYIQSCLPEYNMRLDLETASHFPVLKKTDEELLKIVKEHPSKIAFLSPWTKIYKNLHVVLRYLYMNTNAKDTAPLPITIVVNSGDMLYPLPLFDVFAKQLKESYPNATIKASSYERYKGDNSFYLGFDMFFLYDHEKFFNAPFITELFGGKSYKQRIIYTTPYISKKMGLNPNEYAKSLASTGAALNLFVDFYYMPNGIELGNNFKPEENKQ